MVFRVDSGRPVVVLGGLRTQFSYLLLAAIKICLLTVTRRSPWASRRVTVIARHFLMVRLPIAE